MAQVLKEVVASQKFLSGLRTLSHYVELQRKQLERLRPIVNKSFMSVDVASKVVDSLSEEIWDHRVLNELKELIAAKISECEDDANRASLQDFCALPCLLSREWWQVLESRKSGISKLEDISALCGQLSLRNPTEATYGMVVCLAFFSEYGEAWKESEQLALLKQHKSKIKKWLSKFGPCSTRLATLPESREDLPHDMQVVLYPDGYTMGQPSIMSLERLRRLVANFRLRDRSKEWMLHFQFTRQLQVLMVLPS